MAPPCEELVKISEQNLVPDELQLGKLLISLKNWSLCEQFSQNTSVIDRTNQDKINPDTAGGH